MPVRTITIEKPVGCLAKSRAVVDAVFFPTFQTGEPLCGGGTTVSALAQFKVFSDSSQHDSILLVCVLLRLTCQPDFRSKQIVNHTLYHGTTAQRPRRQPPAQAVSATKWRRPARRRPDRQPSNLMFNSHSRVGGCTRLLGGSLLQD
jgi:hypothetical protein